MTMTSKERVMTTFDFKEPDHVPAWMGASPEFRAMMQEHLGLPDDESLSVHLGDDFRRVFARYAGPEEHSPSYNLPPGATYRTPFGVNRHGYGYGMPLNRPLVDATSLDDLYNFPWPQAEWMDVSRIRGEIEQYKGEYAILGGDWAPYWHDVLDLLTFEGLSFKMYDEPDFIDLLLQYIVDYYWGVSQRIFEAAGDLIDIFFIGNDFGAQNGPLIGLKHFERFFLPHLKRLIDLGHDYGMKVLLHCCGGFEPLLPSMIEAGLDGVQALQPNCRGMDPGQLKVDFGDQIVLMGAIDTQLLIEGTPDQARLETKRILEIMKPGGGYVASPSHDYLLPETPVENVLAVYETIKEFGAYN
ncbi:MAG: uroporphyrinogen decarboxylase family protein [Chloroflexota bacterium]